MRSEQLFAGLTTTVFVIVVVLVGAHHEMWRDESQAWLIARDSGTLGELAQNMRYEGHPGAWHLLLFGITRWTHDPRAMQVVTVLAAAVSCWIVSRYAPFSRLVRVLWIFGYFPLYEYGVIARSYTLSVLLSSAAVALMTRARPKWWLVAGLSVLLSHTCVHGVILSGGLVAAAILLHAKSSEARVPHWRFGLSVGVMVVGMLGAAYEMIPPADSGFQTEWYFAFDGQRVSSTLLSMTRACLPLPPSKVHFWESCLWQDIEIVNSWASWIGAMLLVGGLGLCRHSRPAMAMYLVVCAGLLAFFYIKFSAGMRHDGFLWLTAFLAVWIAWSDRASQDHETSAAITMPAWQAYGCIILLVLQCEAALVAVSMDWKSPFSGAQQAARYILQEGYVGHPVSAEPDFVAASVLAYTGISHCTQARADREGSFVIWDSRRVADVADHEILPTEEIIRRSRSQSSGDFLLITNQSFQPANYDSRFQFLAAFNDCTVRDEAIVLYRFSEPVRKSW